MMDLQKISMRSKCCILLEQAKINSKITSVCKEDVLLKNLEILISKKLCEAVSSFPEGMQTAILQEEETLQFMLKLLEPEVPIYRTKQMLEQVPLKDLMRYEPEEVREVLSNQQIAGKYMGIYLKYYREDGLNGEDLSKLWRGLECFQRSRTNLTDDWLENIDKKRSLLMEPIITNNFIQRIQNYDACLLMLSQREDVLQLLNILCQADDGESVLDDIAMEELCANTKQLAELWNWAQGFFEKSQLAKFLQLWLQNHALVYDLVHLKKSAESGEKINAEAILTGRASYIAFFYNIEFPGELEGAHEELIIYAITHKKRAFLNLVRENIQLYKGISPCSVLFCRTFYDKCLNVNTMNDRNLAACGEMMNRRNIAWNLLAEREHTFEELALIYSRV